MNNYLENIEQQINDLLGRGIVRTSYNSIIVIHEGNNAHLVRSATNYILKKLQGHVNHVFAQPWYIGNGTDAIAYIVYECI